MLNDLAPPLKIHNIPYFYYGFDLRESEGHFLLANLLTWAGFLRLIQYLSLAQEKKVINKNRLYLIKGLYIFIYLTLIFIPFTSSVVILPLDFNLNNGGLWQWLFAGFISISIALMLSILVYKNLLGVSNNYWKTLYILLQYQDKCKLFIGFLVTFVLILFLFLVYINIFIYIFHIEKVSYTHRLIIAFSLIVPLGCIFGILKSRKVIIIEGIKYTKYDFNSFRDYMLNSISMPKILLIFTGISFSSYFDIPAKLSGFLESEIYIETKFRFNNTIRPIHILSSILESMLSRARSIPLYHIYIPKPSLIKATTGWVKDGPAGGVKLRSNWVEYNNSRLKGGLAKVASFEDTSKSGHNQDFNRWCKTYNISITSETGDSFAKWCIKYGINPSWILYPFHPEWKSRDYLLSKLGAYYLGPTPRLRGGGDNNVGNFQNFSNPEPLFIDTPPRDPDLLRVEIGVSNTEGGLSNKEITTLTVLNKSYDLVHRDENKVLCLPSIIDMNDSEVVNRLHDKSTSDYNLFYNQLVNRILNTSTSLPSSSGKHIDRPFVIEPANLQKVTQSWYDIVVCNKNNY